ncbi:MAG: hypothetical protein WD021_06445 [Rhodothermales bacterium]
MRMVLFGLLLAALAVPVVYAQDAGDMVADIDRAYRQLKYEEAEALAVRALGRYPDFTIQELSDIHVYLALIAYSRGDIDQAGSHFMSALQLSPDLRLDPVLVPPKIQEFVEDLRRDAVAGEVDAYGPAVRYVLIRDPRVDAALRSALIPGWGQLHKGHTVKGLAFAGAFVTAASAAVLAQSRRVDARRRYDSAPTRQSAEGHYDTYADWGRTRNVFVAASALIWGVGYVDALLTPPARMPSSSFSIQASPNLISFRIRL